MSAGHGIQQGVSGTGGRGDGDAAGGVGDGGDAERLRGDAGAGAMEWVLLTSPIASDGM